MTQTNCRTCLILVLLSGAAIGQPPAASPAVRPAGALRVATYNVSMYRERPGQLLEELEAGDSAQARRIAEVLQRVRPDVVLLNEFDYFDDRPSRNRKRSPQAFIDLYLGQPQSGQQPLGFKFMTYSRVNTGVDSGRDLDQDGSLGEPADAWGFGRYPGQYGMLLLSRLPLAVSEGASFTDLRWKELPHPTWPRDPKTGEHYYDQQTRDALRLPSKSFWHDVVKLPGGRRLHLLSSHPTPPVFDGPEDRNGCRNFDEIRMVAHYISQRGGKPFWDDTGEGNYGMPADASFVVLGDLNADPIDGGGRPGAIQQLLDHPAVNSSFTPTSHGAVASSAEHADLNADHRGAPAHDTADFSGDGHGNLRVDYVLPSTDIKVLGGGVFWPRPGEPGAEAITASDHRLVWLDIEIADR